jgi:hypothetical protein
VLWRVILKQHEVRLRPRIFILRIFDGSVDHRLSN